MSFCVGVVLALSALNMPIKFRPLQDNFYLVILVPTCDIPGTFPYKSDSKFVLTYIIIVKMGETWGWNQNDKKL